MSFRFSEKHLKHSTASDRWGIQLASVGEPHMDGETKGFQWELLGLRVWRCWEHPDITLYKNSKHSHLAWAILSKVSGTGSVLPELEGNLNTSMTIFSGCQGVFSSISNKVHSQSLDSSSNRELITSWRNLVCFFLFLAFTTTNLYTEWTFPH